MLDDATPRGWAFHESFTTAYHESASTRIPFHEDTYTVRTSSRPRPSASAAASARLDRNLPPLRPAASSPAEPKRAVARRRPMYDPVRDSASSRLPASPILARPAAPSPRPHHTSDDDDRKTAPACRSCGEPHAGDCTSASLWRQFHDGDDEPGRAQILRRLSQRQNRDYLAAGKSSSLVWCPTDVPAEQAREASTSVEESDVPRLPPISVPDQVGAVVQELREKYPRVLPTWEQDHRSSGKRPHAHVDGTTDRRSPPFSGHPASYLEIQGKRKMMSSQSPAFRLDNLLESSPVEPSRPPARSGGYDLPSYDPPPTAEPAHARAPSIPVFTGRLPPTPFTGSSSLGSATHTSFADLGISVSKDVDLEAFAVADDFERDIFAQPSSSQSTSFASSSRLPEPAPGSKAPRKLAATAPRRKSRGLFPHDDVPLVISSSTTKQSRYRPSGDRQPVACGYKDPITQVQCDEPFNRPVELRRHVRAVHVPAEALAVTMGQLSRSQAKLLPNDWKPGDGDVLRPTCVCGKVFSRLDALRRHWTGVNAKVVDGKCIECPSSLAKKKDRAGPDHLLEQGNESIYAAPAFS
ncbi:hypothetical protein FRC08_004540 [Ceratobasidium sp. 394]|nr:hypothetical protein FRC08_004540 [Ceratobasidium sp. 394]